MRRHPGTTSLLRCPGSPPNSVVFHYFQPILRKPRNTNKLDLHDSNTKQPTHLPLEGVAPGGSPVEQSCLPITWTLLTQGTESNRCAPGPLTGNPLGMDTCACYLLLRLASVKLPLGRFCSRSPLAFSRMICRLGFLIWFRASLDVKN
jgi:hypothetical protein